MVTTSPTASLSITNPFDSNGSSTKGYSAIANSESSNGDETSAENGGLPIEDEPTTTFPLKSKWFDRSLFFFAGVVFMLLLSLAPFHIHCFTEECRAELEKELKTEKDELALDENIIVEEEVEIKQDADELAKLHAKLARERIERCRNVDWLEACDRIGQAGARRKNRALQENDPIFNFIEEDLLESDDPAVFYDEHCLRRYRMKFDGKITFPYHASQLIHRGGEQTMALFIQHGAMRDADTYFCSFAKLMMTQTYRPFKDILVIAPNFEYKRDVATYPYDAFWNSTKVSGVDFCEGNVHIINSCV
jgi:hypothetical protein